MIADEFYELRYRSVDEMCATEKWACHSNEVNIFGHVLIFMEVFGVWVKLGW